MSYDVFRVGTDEITNMGVETMQTQVSEVAATRGNHEDADYDGFIARMNARLLRNCSDGDEPLFTTDATGLWDLYLAGFEDPVERQYHNCHCCRHFVDRFGALVTIGEDGSTTPAFWSVDDSPPEYAVAISEMVMAVRLAKVTGVFRSSDPTWGTPRTGVWRHMALQPSPRMLLKLATLTAGQAMAEKREDFHTVMRALSEFTKPNLETALTMLKADSLYRSEKVLGQAEWLHALHVARAMAHGVRKANVVWRAVANAPAGFCHPRSSMIGTLLEDIAAGKDFDEVARAFKAKMHPLSYQRPQAAPTSGAIEAAEKLVAKLGLERSLPRRFARLDEVQAIWRPAQKKGVPSSGVFSHLKPKGSEAAPMAIAAGVMTWEKFSRTVLPTAEVIQLLAPHHGPYTAMVTAVNLDAPPILQWDVEGARNPVSWYFWNGGASAAQFNLGAGRYVEVEAITLKPSMWNGGNEHHGAGVVFILEGARESRQAGAALFPEILKSELREVRSVIESYSKGATIEGMGEPHAAGIGLSKGNAQWDCIVRVRSGGQSLEYRLDRWD